MEGARLQLLGAQLVSVLVDVDLPGPGNRTGIVKGRILDKGGIEIKVAADRHPAETDSRDNQPGRSDGIPDNEPAQFLPPFPGGAGHLTGEARLLVVGALVALSA